MGCASGAVVLGGFVFLCEEGEKSDHARLVQCTLHLESMNNVVCVLMRIVCHLTQLLHH